MKFHLNDVKQGDLCYMSTYDHEFKYSLYPGLEIYDANANVLWQQKSSSTRDIVVFMKFAHGNSTVEMLMVDAVMILHSVVGLCFIQSRFLYPL
jgi:hypothetical protein